MHVSARLSPAAAVQAASATQEMLEEVWASLLKEAASAGEQRALGSDPAFHHDILALSRQLWGAVDAPSLYATHCLLREDRLFFFRLKTRPPTFHVRPAAEVETLRLQHKLVRPVWLGNAFRI